MKIIKVRCGDAEFSPTEMEERIHRDMNRGASHITQQLDPGDKRYKYAKKILQDFGFILKRKFMNLGTVMEEWQWDK